MSDIPDEVLLQQFGERENEQVGLLWVFAVLVRGRRLIAIAGVTGLVLGIIVALLRPVTYTSSFAIVQASQDATSSGLADLAGQFGVSLGASGGQTLSPQLYADLVSTRSLLSQVITDTVRRSEGGEPVTIAEYLDASGETPVEVAASAISILRDDVVQSEVDAGMTGVVTVSTRTRSPDVSLQVAQSLLDGLIDFNVSTRQSQAGAERVFVEGRLAAAREMLRAAEDSLQSFMEANRNIQAPGLMIEQERIQRNVVQQQSLVTSLIQQYEDARIREVRDIPLITVIESPTRATRADPRKLIFIVVSGAALAILAAMSVILVRDAFARRMSDPDDPAVELLGQELAELRRRPDNKA